MAIKKILIAVDESKYAEHAAEYGFDMARFYKAEVGVVYIVAPMIFPSSGTDVITGLPVENNNIDELALIKIQSETAENIIQQTIKKFAADLEVTHYPEYATTAEVILRCAKQFGVNMIVSVTH